MFCDDSTHVCGGYKTSGFPIDGNPICRACLMEAGLSADAAAAISTVEKYVRGGPPGSWEHRGVTILALRAALQVVREAAEDEAAAEAAEAAFAEAEAAFAEEEEE